MDRDHNSSGYRDYDDQDDKRRRATSLDPIGLDIRGQAIHQPFTPKPRKELKTPSQSITEEHNVSTMIVIKT